MILLAVLAAHAREPEGDSLVVTVRSSGAIVPTARVAIDDEEGWHAVNAVTGGFETHVLYFADGREVPIGKGEAHRLRVVAPGFAPSEIALTTDTKRVHTVEVELSALELGPYAPDPAAFSLDPDGLAKMAAPSTASVDDIARFGQVLAAQGLAQKPAVLTWTRRAFDDIYALDGADYVARRDRVLGIRAVNAHLWWQQAAQAYAVDPTEANQPEKARNLAFEAARDWAAWESSADVDPAFALNLCAAAAFDPGACR